MNLLVESLLSVLYPPECPCCGATLTRGEKPMCLACRLRLPLTGFADSPANNDLIDKLNGLVPIERATAYFTYRRDSPQARLIHAMKYHGRPSIGRDLAREYARTILSTGFFNGIDAIVPVPLNFWRHCSRGYNQSAHIARGLSDVTSIAVIDAMSARRHKSQTRLGADSRLSAAKGIFTAGKEALKGVAHVLLVDDICTTGATLYACAEAIHTAAPDVKISVLVLASTALS